MNSIVCFLSQYQVTIRESGSGAKRGGERSRGRGYSPNSPSSSIYIWKQKTAPHTHSTGRERYVEHEKDFESLRGKGGRNLRLVLIKTIKSRFPDFRFPGL